MKYSRWKEGDGAKDKDEGACYNTPSPANKGAPLDRGLSGSQWEIKNPAWSRVHCVHEMWWCDAQEVFPRTKTILDSSPERTLCGVMSNTPNSSAVLAGSWLCTDLETD